MILLLRFQSRAVDWCRLYWLKLFVLTFIVNLPDLDFLFGVAGHPNESHRGFTHSLAVAVAFSLGFALLYFVAYGSHLLIDLCTGTGLGLTHSGSGIPLFWPWDQLFSSSLILIFGVQHANLAALFSIDNPLSCTYNCSSPVPSP